MNVRILPAAKADLRRGYRFYEHQAPGVGAYFLDALYADIDSIQLFGGFHKQRGNLHRFKAKRFPYWIYYRVEGDVAFVVAVLDARQLPARVAHREKIEQSRAHHENSPEPAAEDAGSRRQSDAFPHRE